MVGALNGNDSPNRQSISSTLSVTVPPGNVVWMKWMDVDDLGSDHGLAIDDLTVTAN
jgi:hypothetical protein